MSTPLDSKNEKVRINPSVKIVLFIFSFALFVITIAAIRNGTSIISLFLSISCFIFGVPYFFLYFPNKYTSLNSEGVVHREAFGFEGWTPWERVKHVSWNNIREINGIFGFMPPKWVHVNGRYLVETSGKFEGRSRQDDTVQLPMSPFPWIMSGIADEAISYICQRVNSKKIRPEVIQYLKRRGLYDPERHPKPEECKGRK